MTDPKRFLALYPDGVTHASNESQEVQDAAQEYAAAHPGEFVHLYAHAVSIRSRPDGE